MLTFETARAELTALISTTMAMPFQRRLASDSLDHPSTHPTPVVLIHGLGGSPATFWRLRQHLASQGITRFASFAYAPRIDYQALAPKLGEFLEEVCTRAGAPEVDVVGHSLGGLIARYLIEQGNGRRIRRLVSLGSPWYTARFPSRELAVFAAADWLIPAPDPRKARGQVVLLSRCSHLSLLFDAGVQRYVTAHLTAPPRTIRLAVQPRGKAA